MTSTTDYGTRAEQHRPKDTAAIEMAIRRLARTGLRPTDIASLLHVHPLTVTRVLSRGIEAAP